MLRIFTAFAFFMLFSLSIFSQTITEVQSFTYESTTRDTVIEFPTDDHNNYEKILMVYSMRCKDGLVSPGVAGQTNIGCGEWDYSCNTYITDSTRVDSFYAVSPTHQISNFSGDVFDYTTQPTYTYYQSTQQEVVYNNVVTETEVTYGGGNSDLDFPFGMGETVARTQLLYQYDLLTMGGLTSGNITGLKLDAADIANDFNNLRIRMKNTTKGELDAATIDNDGFTEVYFLNTDLAVGNNFFKFHSPFIWDGTSNVLVDISYSRTGTSATTLKSDVQPGISSLNAQASNDQSIEFNGSGYVEVNHALDAVENEITVSFWSKGSDVLPLNTYAFEGTDAANLRQINVHLPWSNGQIYWDCGNDGSGYDRINKPAAENEFKNEWNHMAFTKNATTGDMKIYINGNLWHSGTGMNRPIDVQAFRIGNAMSGNRDYFGKMDDFQIWNKELSQETIQEWMSKSLTIDHPDYNNLIANYTFDNAVGNEVVDASPNSLNGTTVGPIAYRNYDGQFLEKNISEWNDLPNAIFVQGEYDQTINEITTLDSLINIPNQVDEYTLNGTDLELANTNYYFASGQMPVFDNNGNLVDSIAVATENTINIGELTHYTKRPAKFEIMSFVTPYGINLDLGIEGKAWTFDVTDFGPILKGKKRITMERGGQWQEDMDIKFLFIEGTPSRNVIDIQQVWPVTQENYARIQADVRFEPRNLTLPASAQTVLLKAGITGHGQEGEFIPRQHFLNIDGDFNEFQWSVWKECAENPVHPQGGTWVYDRAGWCPGEATDIEVSNLTEWVSPGDEIELDYGVVTASGDSRYIVNVQMVSYGPNNFSSDAELLDIINPSTKIKYGKYNPMCGKPKILIKNNGTSPLTSLDISYDVDGNSPQTYTWTGFLNPFETEEVELPQLASTALTSPNAMFNVTISNPNGGADEYANNDSKSTTFEVVPMLSKDVVIQMTTNFAPGESAYRVYDINGTIIAAKAGFLSSNTTYRDTLYDINGCFRVEFTDSDDDGISWWANGDGNGSIAIKSLGEPYTFLEPDFGRFLNYEFIAGDITPTHDILENKFLKVYPNPSSDLFFVELEGYDGDLQLEIINQVGQTMTMKFLENNPIGLVQEKFDLSKFSAGIYFLKIHHGNEVVVRKLVKM